MMRGMAMWFAAAAVLTAGFGVAADDSERYRWPLDQQRILTSSFGEFRSAGFHMGIDLRTGTVGKEVYAPAPGYVERIRCSPYGYGKALYFRLDDGNLFVYAHLSDYADVLRDHVRAEQHRGEKYEVDMQLPKDRFRFDRGQLLALSGQTGIGAPHLHFEVRDAAGVPIDPRTLGFDWPDTTPPQIAGVLVEPARPDVSVDGAFLPVTLSAQSGAGGLVVRGLRASGPVRFAISATDSAGAQGTRLGIAGAKVSASDKSLFDLDFNAIPYESYADGAVSFHPYFRGSTRYLTLWPWPGNRVRAYAPANGSGELSPAGAETASLRVRDAHGNEQSITVPVELAPSTESTDPAQANTGAGTVRFEPVSTWVVCIVTFPSAESERPMLRMEGAEQRESEMVRVNSKEFQFPIAAAKDAERLIVTIAHPRVSAAPTEFVVFHRGRSPRPYERDGLQIAGSADSAYGTLIFRSERLDPQSHGELSAIGDSFNIWHENHPIAAPLRITFPIPQGTDASRVHVYRRSDGWSRQDTTRSGAGLTIETRRLGLFQAFEDRHAPFLRITSPPEGYQAQTKRPIVTARVADAHSGVDGYGATLNGKWLLVAYDPEHEELVWDRDEDLPSGQQTIEFWATDNAGNAARKSVSVLIP